MRENSISKPYHVSFDHPIGQDSHPYARWSPATCSRLCYTVNSMSICPKLLSNPVRRTFLGFLRHLASKRSAFAYSISSRPRRIMSPIASTRAASTTIRRSAEIGCFITGPDFCSSTCSRVRYLSSAFRIDPR